MHFFVGSGDQDELLAVRFPLFMQGQGRELLWEVNYCLSIDYKLLG